MELIYPDGTPGLQADCGLQMQGGASRLPERTPKHSFRVDFKSGYGPKELDYQVFGDSPVASFKTLVLDRAGLGGRTSGHHLLDEETTSSFGDDDAETFTRRTRDPVDGTEIGRRVIRRMRIVAVPDGREQPLCQVLGRKGDSRVAPPTVTGAQAVAGFVGTAGDGYRVEQFVVD